MPFDDGSDAIARAPAGTAASAHTPRYPLHLSSQASTNIYTTTLQQDVAGAQLSSSTITATTSSRNSSSPSSTPTASSKPKSSSGTRKAPPTFHFLAGLCTGALSAALLQPADLLKTRVQQRRGLSVLGVLRDILRQPGVVRELWRGTLPSVIRTGLGSAMYFASLNALRAGMAERGVGTVERKEEKKKRNTTTGTSGSMGQELSRVADLARTSSSSSSSGEGALSMAKTAATATAGGEDGVGGSPGPALDSTVSVHTPPPPSSSSSQTPRVTNSNSQSTATISGSLSSSSSTLPKLSNAANLLAGALARGGAGFVMMPITVLKVRYESSLYASYGRSTGLVGAARAIVAREGLRGLYTGYGATFVRDAPHAGLYVVFYEQAKTLLERRRPGGRGTAAAAADYDDDDDGSGNNKSQKKKKKSQLAAAGTNFVAGCAAAALATAVTNPFDAIKTRLQLMPDRYGNMAAAAATMMREEGPRAFFDGLGLRMARKAVSSALAWTIYEDLVARAELRYAALADDAERAQQAATTTTTTTTAASLEGEQGRR